MANNPEERLILPAKYNLYKVYLELGKPEEADVVKSDIISNYPDSRYAAILNNPELQLERDQNSPESIYENLLQLHENQKYEMVISKCDEAITQFEGEGMVPKFEFLKAIASGRLYGFEAYSKGINYIALNYPNTPEGKKAELLVQEALPKISSSTFVDETDLRNFYVVYKFTNASEDELIKFEKKVNEVVEDIKYYDLKTSIDVYSPNVTFVVIHGLKSKDGAKGLAEILDYKKYKISKEHFAVSSSNYEIIQIHKNLEAYLESQ